MARFEGMPDPWNGSGRFIVALLEEMIARPLITLSFITTLVLGCVLVIDLLDERPRAVVWMFCTAAAFAILLAACGAER